MGGVAPSLGSSIQQPPPTQPQKSSTAANDDDEWTFASAVPDQSKEIVVSNTSINIKFRVNRETSSMLLIQSRISNNTVQPISDLTLQVAVAKVCVL